MNIADIGISLTLMIAFLPALTLFALLLAKYKTVTQVSKERVARVRRGVGAEPREREDMPSIVRERAKFLKNARSSRTLSSTARVLSELESLVTLSGLELSLARLFVWLILFSCSLSVCLFIFFQLNLFVIALSSLAISMLLGILVLNWRRNAQLRKFQEIFPDALDLIVRSVRAGLPVSEAIKSISAEVSAPVSVAFREVASSLAIGISLEDALLVLQRRYPISEVKFFAISLSIQQETGGNLAEILGNLSKMMRRRVQIGKKIRALSSEARASAVIIGSLPFLVGLAIYALNREYIEVLFFDPTGQLLLFAGLGSMLAGSGIIIRLIRFEI